MTREVTPNTKHDTELPKHNRKAVAKETVLSFSNFIMRYKTKEFNKPPTDKTKNPNRVSMTFSAMDEVGRIVPLKDASVSATQVRLEFSSIPNPDEKSFMVLSTA